MLKQFTQSFNAGMVLQEGTFTVGSSGAVSSFTGTGIQNITKLATGMYMIQLSQAYQRWLGGDLVIAGVTTGSTAATALSAGTVYIISSLGTTTQAQWVAAGMPANVTAAVGVTFLATGSTSGTGTCATPSPSGNVCFEIAGNPQTTINTQGGGYIVAQCLGPTSSSVTTLVATNPPSGSVIEFQAWLRNSSVTGVGG